MPGSRQTGAAIGGLFDSIVEGRSIGIRNQRAIEETAKLIEDRQYREDFRKTIAPKIQSTLEVIDAPVNEGIQRAETLKRTLDAGFEETTDEAGKVTNTPLSPERRKQIQQDTQDTLVSVSYTHLISLVPQKADVSDPNTAYFYFAAPKAGRAVLMTVR